jgi:signal peptidase I
MKRHIAAAGTFPRLRTWTLGLWRDFVGPIGLLFLFIAPLKSAVIDWNWVPTGSMKPTIMVGDLVLVNKLAYDLKVPFTTRHLSTWAEPARGDVVVFFSPQDGSRLVKRLVGFPGDSIESRRDALFINGIRQGYSLEDPERFAKDMEEDPHPLIATERLGGRDHLIAILPSRTARRDFGPYVVPSGKYFMMGDSRDNSFDSRFFGSVPRASIVGRASAVIVSFDPRRFLMPRFSRFFRPLAAGTTGPAAAPHMH